MSAKAGDHVFVRRYLDSTDEQYRMVWSDDDGATWTPSEPQTLVTPDASGTAYDGYYLVEYVVPKDAADGSTITIQLKMWSKAEFDTNGIEGTKAASLAALQAAYDAYDLTQYDDAGKAALLQALEDGKTAVNAAVTNDAVAEARKAAIAAMAAVPVAAGQQINSSFDSGATVGQVYVTIENTTFNDTPLAGTLVEGWYPLGEKDTMMTVVLKVLEDSGYTWTGTGSSGGGDKDYSITYLAGISKDGETLAEFTGGTKSGWMGTLNDWFVNEGFPAFSVANGKLENNDVIRIMYTADLGADIGGTWGNNDTSLRSLTISAGTLAPAFDSSVTDYMLIIPEDVTSLTVTPEASNKNYQSRIFLNSYNQDSAMFKCTELIPVESGDEIYIGVGEKGWPTMNNGGKPTKYTVTIVAASEAADGLDPVMVDLQNYKSYEAILAVIDRDALSEEGKATYAAVQSRIDFFKEVDAVKAQIAALPNPADVTSEDKEAIEAAKAAYDALTDAQKKLLTKAEVMKLEAAEEALGIEVKHSLNLQDEILVNFYYIGVDADQAADSSVKFTFQGTETTVTGGTTTTVGGRPTIVYTFATAAKKMTEPITAELTIAGEVVDTHEYTVKQYCDDQLTKADIDAGLKKLLEATLNYGGYSQTYFSYNTGKMANAGIDSTLAPLSSADIDAPAFDKAAVTTGVKAADLTYEGATLALEANTILKLYFKPSGITQDAALKVPVKVNGEDAKLVKNGKYVCLIITGIKPKYLGQAYEITVGDYSFSYGPLNYIKTQLDGTDANLKNVLTAMYYYYQAAKEYFNA